MYHPIFADFREPWSGASGQAMLHVLGRGTTGAMFAVAQFWPISSHPGGHLKET